MPIGPPVRDSLAALHRIACELRDAVGSLLPPLILVTDSAHLPDPVAAARRLPHGCAVLLRHYEDPARERLAVELAAVCNSGGHLLLIGGDADLARRVGAGGLHLPQRDVARFTREEWPGVVTAAAHSAAAVGMARTRGADAVLLSPVFATASHPETEPLGVDRFAAIAGAARLPVYALGGISAANSESLRASGAAGIAAVGAFAR